MGLKLSQTWSEEPTGPFKLQGNGNVKAGGPSMKSHQGTASPLGVKIPPLSYLLAGLHFLTVPQAGPLPSLNILIYEPPSPNPRSPTWEEIKQS